jgi:hypothetical protein
MIFTISGRSGSGRTEWITSDYLTEPDTFMTCRAPIEHGARHIPTRLDDIIILRVFYNVSAGVTRIGHRGYQELNRATNHMRSRSVDSINSLRLSPFLLLVQHPNFCHKDFCSLRAECFISAKHHDSKVQEGTDHTKRANSGSQELVRGVYSGLIFLIEGLGARQFVLPDGACVSRRRFFSSSSD